MAVSFTTFDPANGEHANALITLLNAYEVSKKRKGDLPLNAKWDDSAKAIWKRAKEELTPGTGNDDVAQASVEALDKAVEKSKGGMGDFFKGIGGKLIGGLLGWLLPRLLLPDSMLASIIGAFGGMVVGDMFANKDGENMFTKITGFLGIGKKDDKKLTPEQQKALDLASSTITFEKDKDATVSVLIDEKGKLILDKNNKPLALDAAAPGSTFIKVQKEGDRVNLMAIGITSKKGNMLLEHGKDPLTMSADGVVTLTAKGNADKILALRAEVLKEADDLKKNTASKVQLKDGAGIILIDGNGKRAVNDLGQPLDLKEAKPGMMGLHYYLKNNVLQVRGVSFAGPNVDLSKSENYISNPTQPIAITLKNNLLDLGTEDNQKMIGSYRRYALGTVRDTKANPELTFTQQQIAPNLFKCTTINLHGDKVAVHEFIVEQKNVTEGGTKKQFWQVMRVDDETAVFEVPTFNPKSSTAEATVKPLNDGYKSFKAAQEAAAKNPPVVTPQSTAKDAQPGDKSPPPGGPATPPKEAVERQ